MWLEDECLFGKARFYAGGHVCQTGSVFFWWGRQLATRRDAQDIKAYHAVSKLNGIEEKEPHSLLLLLCRAGPRLLFFVEAAWSWMILIKSSRCFISMFFGRTYCFHKITREVVRMWHIAQPNSVTNLRIIPMPGQCQSVCMPRKKASANSGCPHAVSLRRSTRVECPTLS